MARPASFSAAVAARTLTTETLIPMVCPASGCIMRTVTFSSSAVVALGRTEVSATINTRYCRLLYAIGSSSTALLAASIRTAKN